MYFNNFTDVDMAMPILIILIAWSFLWKGLALWHSAKHNQGWWFIVLFLINTFGILEIIYLFGILKLKKEHLFPKRTS